jgi:hypothetical protein
VPSGIDRPEVEDRSAKRDFSNSCAFKAEKPSPELTTYVRYVKSSCRQGVWERMLSISAVWPPEPRTIRMCVGLAEDGCERRDGGGRERILTRRKKMMLTKMRVVTRSRMSIWLVVVREVIGETRLVIKKELEEEEISGGLLSCTRWASIM